MKRLRDELETGSGSRRRRGAMSSPGDAGHDPAPMNYAPLIARRNRAFTCKLLRLCLRESRISWKRKRHPACKPLPQAEALYTRAASRLNSKNRRPCNPCRFCILLPPQRMLATKPSTRLPPWVIKTFWTCLTPCCCSRQTFPPWAFRPCRPNDALQVKSRQRR